MTDKSVINEAVHPALRLVRRGGLRLVWHSCSLWSCYASHTNSSTGSLVQAFQAKHRRVPMHDRPTYSSWLKQVENWFARIQRDVITRGIFSSIKDLGM